MQMPNSKTTRRSLSICGCGWLGWPLARRLLGAGHPVAGSTTSPEKLPLLERDGIAAHRLRLAPEPEGDVADLLASDILVVSIPPGGRDAESGARYEQEMEAFARAAGEHGVQRAIFISSTSVYGDADGDVVDEETPAEPSRASGHSVLEGERSWQRHVPQTTVLRSAGQYGPGRWPGRWFAGRKDVPDGDRRVNMVHLDDLVGAVLAVIDQDMWGETFNVCAREHPTRAAFYTAAARSRDLDPPTFRSGGADTGKVVSAERLHEVLGYEWIHPDPLQDVGES